MTGRGRNQRVAPGRHRLHRLDERLFGQFRHLQANRRLVHAARIHLRTEENRVCVLAAVSLQALEGHLREMQKLGGRVELNGSIRQKRRVSPCAVLIVDSVHDRREHAAETELIGENESIQRCGNFRVNMDCAHGCNMHRSAHKVEYPPFADLTYSLNHPR